MVDGAKEKITLTERKSLSLPYNLADAQNYVSWSADQQRIIDRFPSIFRTAARSYYDATVNSFLPLLFNSLDQAAALDKRNRKLLCYSATIGLEVALNYLRRHAMDDRPVGILHPTFDTIPYIATRQGLKVQPVSESKLQDIANGKFAPSLSALVLTLPNNPTGITLTEPEFQNLIASCKTNDLTLVVDCCYRYYAKERFDYYKLLLESGVDYLLVEDTGKLFPLVDIKVGVLCCNESIYESVESIHTDFLLEVSKFSLEVISEFLEVDNAGPKEDHFKIIESNRLLLTERLNEFDVTPIGGENINIQLLRLPAGLDSTRLQKDLMSDGVGVVDGKRLYWKKQPQDGCRIRVALSREQEHFREAVNRISSVLRQQM